MFLAIAFSGVGVTAPASLASANDLPDNCSYDPNDYHIIKFFGSWPSPTQTLAQDGFGWWSNVKDLNGNPAVQTTYGWHGDTEAVWVDWSPDGSWGFGLCGSAYMEFYASAIGAYASSNPNMFRSITAHEYGHVLGLGHAGAADSHDGTTPVMATSRGLTFLSQDDRSAIQAVKHEDEGGNVFWPTPNASFEDGLAMWAFNAVSTQLNSYGATGSRSLRVMANGAYPQQAVSITRLMDWQGHNLDQVRIAAFIKRPFSNTYGHVTLATMVGRATYTRGESNGFPDIHGWDGSEVIQNNGASLTWTAWYGVDCSPSTSWTICADPTWRPKPSNADAVDLAAIAMPNIYISGTSTPSWVDIDQLSVLADF